MPRARILAVDDQRYFRELIEGLLTGEGYSVRTASSGEEALHVLEREDFDVVVTDLVMPGIDGSQLVAEVKERDPDQDIIMVTGVVDVKTAVDAMKQGATDYILKPFDRKTLTRSLEAILQRRRLRDEHARLMAENLEYMEVLSLYERAAGLFSTLRVDPLAERIVEGLCLETRAQGGVIWIAEDHGETRHLLAGARGLIRMEEEPEELQISSLGEELAVPISEGLSVIAPAVAGGEGEGEEQVLYVPLRHGGTLIGLARLSDKLEGGAFDDRDRAAAEKFVTLASSAVVNALRFRSLERRSFRDPTTRAYTDAYFDDALRNEIQKANRFGRQFSVVRIDLGALGELRRTEGEREVAHWLESIVHQAHQALRSTDLLAVESDRRLAVLLPETDAVGGAVLKARIRRAIEDSGVLDSMRSETRQEIALAVATFPTDGTQVEALDRVLGLRLDEHRGSLLRSMDLMDLGFADAVDVLMETAEPAPVSMTWDIAQFLIQEIARHAEDRGLLVLAPGAALENAVSGCLARLGERENRMEVVFVSDAAPDTDTTGGTPVTWVPRARTGTDRPFLLYYGEGPAYAIVTETKPDASAPVGASLPLFHTSDRSLVEHLAFQLQRDLGIPLGA